jgi:hypothetical protein
VTCDVHVDALSLGSRTVNVTVVTPSASAVPAGGACVTVVAPHASLAESCARRSGSTAEQFGPAGSVMSGGHALIVGAARSATVKFAVHVVKLPAGSVAVNVITIVPSASVAPGNGDCVIVTVPLSSLAPTSARRSGIGGAHAAPAVSVRSLGHVVIVGGVVSVTTTDAVAGALSASTPQHTRAMSIGVLKIQESRRARAGAAS